MSDLEFTGERLVPGKTESDLWKEHYSRYILAGLWARGRRVLDFGSGAGYGLQILVDAGARRAAGCDIALDALLFSASEYPPTRGRLVAADCLRPPFATGRFDLVVGFEIVEHVTSHERFLDEAKRLLDPSGILVLSTPNKKTYTDDARRRNPFHEHEFYLPDFRRALTDRFSEVVLFAQFACEGLLFRRLAPADGAPGAVRLLGAPSGDSAAEARWGEGAEFFLAVCSDQPLEQRLDLPLGFLYPGEPGEIAGLKAELQVRTRWALDLDRQLGERGERLLELQSEFDERTEWALKLDAEARALKARVLELEARIQELERRGGSG